MRARSAVLLGALLVATSGCHSRLADVSDVHASPEPPHAVQRIAAHVIVDDPIVLERLRKADLFESIELAGAPVPSENVDAVLGLRLVHEDWTGLDPFTGGFRALHIAGLIPPWIPLVFFELVYLEYTRFEMRYALTLASFGGEAPVTEGATAKIAEECQAATHAYPGTLDKRFALATTVVGPLTADALVADASLARRTFQGPHARWLAGTALVAVDPAAWTGDVPESTGYARPSAARWLVARLRHAVVADNKHGTLRPAPVVEWSSLDGERRVGRVALGATGLSWRDLERARAASLLYRRQADVLGGRPCTWVVTPRWSPRAQQPTDVEFALELYDGDPESSPLREVFELGPPIADGVTPTVYSKTEPELVGVHVVFANGRPVRVEKDAGEPSIDAFLGPGVPAKERVIADGKWRNRALVAVKNRSLPRFLTSATTAELTALVTRLEQHSLDVAHEEELVKDRAARLVEKNEAADENGDGPDELRELAIVYRERILVLKAILAMTREEIANRGR